MSKYQSTQAGVAATFIIVGIVLVAGLVGGIYFLKQQSSQSPAQDTSTPAEVVVEEEAQSPEDDEARSNEAPAPAPSAQSPEEASPAPSPQVTSNQERLPTTGPEDSFMQLVGAVALTFSTVYYYRSRL